MTADTDDTQPAGSRDRAYTDQLAEHGLHEHDPIIDPPNVQRPKLVLERGT